MYVFAHVHTFIHKSALKLRHNRSILIHIYIHTYIHKYMSSDLQAHTWWTFPAIDCICSTGAAQTP